jgi:hypothetical protein
MALVAAGRVRGLDGDVVQLLRKVRAQSGVEVGVGWHVSSFWWRLAPADAIVPLRRSEVAWR